MDEPIIPELPTEDAVQEPLPCGHVVGTYEEEGKPYCMVCGASAEPPA